MGKKRKAAATETPTRMLCWPGAFLNRSNITVSWTKVQEWIENPTKMKEWLWRMFEGLCQHCECVRQSGYDVTVLKPEFTPIAPDDPNVLKRPVLAVSSLIWLLDECRKEVAARNAVELTPFPESVFDDVRKALWKNEGLDAAFTKYAIAFQQLSDWIRIRQRLNGDPGGSGAPQNRRKRARTITATDEQVCEAINAALEEDPENFPNKSTTRRFLKELFGENCTIENTKLNQGLKRAREAGSFEE